MQNALQCLEKRVVAFLALQLERLFQQVALLEVMKQEVKEVDVDHPHIGPVLRQVIHEELDVVTDAQLILWLIVEDVESDLIANAAGSEEFVGCELRKNLVEAPSQRVTHGRTSMQRSTYSSS